MRIISFEEESLKNLDFSEDSIRRIAKYLDSFLSKVVNFHPIVNIHDFQWIISIENDNILIEFRRFINHVIRGVNKKAKLAAEHDDNFSNFFTTDFFNCFLL